MTVETMKSPFLRRTALAVLLAALLVQACATAEPAPAKKDVKVTGAYVTLTSDEGRQRIERTRHRADYASLMATFEMQERQTLCAVATGVTILNALPLKRPVDPKYAPYAYFTQANYFNEKVDAIITRERTLKIGQTLQQAATIMAAHGALTKAYHAGDSSLDAFRRIARANMDMQTDFIAVNYRRNHVGQPPGAHFSPLAAYDEASDSFLVLDVARYKFPPVWIAAADLFDAMNTLDSDSGKTRGFIVISAPPGG